MNYVRQHRANLAREAVMGVINSRYEAQKERMKQVYDQALLQLDGVPACKRFETQQAPVPMFHLHSGSLFVRTADIPRDNFEAPKQDFIVTFSDDEEEECPEIVPKQSIDSLYVETGSVNSKREDPTENSHSMSCDEVNDDQDQQPKYVIDQKCFDSSSEIELPDT